MGTPKPKITMLTEAGSGIGLGHLSRMQALAGALRAKGARVAWRVEPGAAADRERPGIAWGAWWAGGKPDADIVVVDSYRAPLSRYADLREHARLVVVDDFVRLAYPADLLVNPGLVDSGIYPVPLRNKVLAGPEYVLIRPQFLAPRKLRGRRTTPKVLITAGGAGGGADLLLSMAGAALRVTPAVEIVGGNDELRKEVTRKLPASVRVYGRLGALAMRNAMDRADLAVTAAGQTLHELNARRVAMVAVMLGEDQRHNIEGYARAGALRRPLALSDGNLEESIATDLAALRDPEERKARIRAAAALVDGRGAQRIASAILKMCL
jgi:UDP-2,4-diacetamido-2,4,6-trideoxy-beta-L-altropyranose hydrolase